MKRNAIITMLTLLLCTIIAVGEVTTDSPTLQPPDINMAPGPEYADSLRMFQGIPGIERAPGGRLWAVWYGGGIGEGVDNYVMLVTSDDDGRNWSKLKLVIDIPGDVRAYDPELWIDPQGRMWLSWAQAITYGKDAVLWAMTTENPDAENPTWSKPKRRAHGVMMNKPIVLSSGEWLFPVSDWNTKVNSAQVFVSTDKGQTWILRGQVHAPKEAKHFDEHMVIERKNGDLMMLVRVRYGIGKSISKDRGKTWSPLLPAGIKHPSARFFIRRLNSGKLLLVKHGAIEELTNRSKLTAFLSDDDGETWSKGFMLDERNGVSYPDGVQTPDGTIYIIYDYKRTVDKEILMAVFTEEDVMAGKCVSDGARLRVLVNKATGFPPEEETKRPAAAASDSWAALKSEALKLGKPQWRPMLNYVAGLHEKSTHPVAYPFSHEWEEIGPGYIFGRAFGHWDVVHQILDVMPAYPSHAYRQLLNNIENQEPDGLVPGTIWMKGGHSKRQTVGWLKNIGHPPIWVVGVDDYVKQTGDTKALKTFYAPLVRQIGWFESNRKAENEGYFYNDILVGKWESGVDEGLRFDETDLGPWACIDATSHVYLLYDCAVRWSRTLGMDDTLFRKRRDALKTFIQKDLYSVEDSNFYDIWAIKDKKLRRVVLESMWPLVVGAATKEQADLYIDNYLLNPDALFTPHPISTVGAKEEKFELRMWRGPSWNSMNYWAVRGCLNYGRKDAARMILERALDQTAKQFDRTGTIWEFYHPMGGNPEDVQRKPANKKYNMPCTDYLGHNPVMAMARYYDQLKD